MLGNNYEISASADSLNKEKQNAVFLDTLYISQNLVCLSGNLNTLKNC